MDVGLVGTGRMGSAIAARLLARGHRVFVWNRTKVKAQPLLDEGASWCDTPATVTESAGLVLSVLTDANAIEAVYFGERGLVAPQRAGRTFVEMSTVRPATQRNVRDRVLAAGSALVECPVGGTATTAAQGQLMAFVGGEANEIERAMPVIADLCRRVEHVGPVGAGASVKLAVNLPLIVYWQALSEALSLIEHLHLDPQRIIGILAESSGGPNMLRMRGAAIAQALAGRDTGPAHFTVGILLKDLRTMCAEALEHGCDLPLVETALAAYEQAAAAPETDGIRLPALWLERMRATAA